MGRYSLEYYSPVTARSNASVAAPLTLCVLCSQSGHPFARPGCEEALGLLVHQPGTIKNASPLKSSYGILRISAKRRTASRAAASVAPEPRGAAPKHIENHDVANPAGSFASANDF